MTRITRLPPTHSRSEYDPQTGRITLAPGATPYQLAHERSHECQHNHGTLAWRIHHAIPGWLPYLPRLTRVWVELQANGMALRALAHGRRCDKAARAEGRALCLHYLGSLLGLSLPIERQLEGIVTAETRKRVVSQTVDEPKGANSSATPPRQGDHDSGKGIIAPTP